MGYGINKVEDFVRLAQPLKQKGCKIADLVPLFRRLWMSPDLVGADWTEEMVSLHDKYMAYTEQRRWLYKALDPGFVFIENPPANDTLTQWLNAIPTQAKAGGGVIPSTRPLGLLAAPVRVGNFRNLVRIHDIHEARQTITSLRQSAVAAGHPNMQLYGVSVALGATTRFSLERV